MPEPLNGEKRASPLDRSKKKKPHKGGGTWVGLRTTRPVPVYVGCSPEEKKSERWQREKKKGGWLPGFLVRGTVIPQQMAGKKKGLRGKNWVKGRKT